MMGASGNTMGGQQLSQQHQQQQQQQQQGPGPPHMTRYLPAVNGTPEMDPTASSPRRTSAASLLSAKGYTQIQVKVLISDFARPW